MNSEERIAKTAEVLKEAFEEMFLGYPLSEQEANVLAKIALEAAGLNELVECTQSVQDVVAERQRQVSNEGWTPEHDDTHRAGEMAKAAACYAWASALPAYSRAVHEGDWWRTVILRRLWPWDRNWWKPKNPRRDLVRAGALILAEIDRIDRNSQGDKSNG